jgi:hypothetical protein
MEIHGGNLNSYYYKEAKSEKITYYMIPIILHSGRAKLCRHEQIHIC